MAIRYLALLIFPILSACGEEPEPVRETRRLDPAVVAALHDPIMIDPDLVSQNRGNAAITAGGFDAVPLGRDGEDR
jgi:hypothetical protein